MREKFQSKHIQEMLDISVDRVAYLASKMKITPEVEEVVGTGRAHGYSFKNAMEFALAHHMNANGLPPGDVRRILDHLTKLDEEFSWEVFVPKEPAEYVDVIAYTMLGHFILNYSGTGKNLSLVLTGGPVKQMKLEIERKALLEAKSTPKRKRKGSSPTSYALGITIDRWKPIQKHLNISESSSPWRETFFDQEISIRLNVSAVKNRVWDYARG